MALGSSIRVLCVDDEPKVVELTAEFLCRENDRFDVVTETSTSAALDRLQDDVACVVSDYQMPGMDGLEFLRAVRASYPDLPFLLFTGKGSEEIASEAISAGVTDYLQKGTGPDQYTILANRVENAVSQFRALRQADLRDRAMETASEGLSLVDSDGTFSYVNSAFAQLFGYDRDELTGTDWTVLYHNEEAERLQRYILPAARETGHWAGETVRLTKQGDRMVTDHRLTNTNEDVIVCTAQDITDERSAPTEPGTTFDLFVDAIEDYEFYTLDHEGYITRWHDDVKQLHGYETGEILGEHLSVVFPEADRQQRLPRKLLETARRDGSATHEGSLLRKDGSRFRADVTLSASADANGTLRGFGTMIRARTPN